MSKAFTSRCSRVPSAGYKRKFTISRHALDRFRERVDEEFRHRDDSDLSNLLDDRVAHAESSYQVRDPRAPQDITTLYSVACRLASGDATYYAVVRDKTVVTVLDEEMAKNNFGGQWRTVLNAPFAGLRELKLAPAATPAPVEPSPASLVPVLPPRADPLAEAGIAYARACKLQAACAAAVASAEADLDRAKLALEEATASADALRHKLLDLAGGTN